MTLSALLFFIYIFQTLPDPGLLERRQVAESTKIYDRAGEILLYEIHGEEKRTVIPLTEIPEVVKQATLAVEDAGFYAHPAFDWKSILRALFANLRQRQVVQGGSTITQQLAKNAFLTPERTLARKIKELILAFRLEKRFTKDEILGLYLNQIAYGSNAYGIEAASQIFFEKSARDLSLAEAALLTSLPKAPSFYSPWGGNRETLFARWDYVLQRMAEEGFITEEEKTTAAKTELKFAPPSRGIKAPHFVIMVQEYLNREYGENFVRSAGLKVITTLDWGLQTLAEKVVANGAKRNAQLYKGNNAALVAQDAQTGQILALVGSKDYFDTVSEGNFNVATQGLRQPGSALKPIFYAAAFRRGFTPETMIFDLATEFDTTGDPEKSYQPGNYDGNFRGPLTLRQALANSINVPAVKVLYLVGLEDGLTAARAFGLTTLTEKSRYGLSLTLGGGEVKLADLINAYSVFAQDGIKHRQSFILKVATKDKVLEEYRDTPERIMESQYIRLVNDILSDAVARRPIFGVSLNLPSLPNHQLAVKTGTSNDFRDAWTIGYTPSLVVGVWAGNNNNEPMTKEGASIAAAVPIWRDFMVAAFRDRPPEVFEKPELVLREKPMLRGEYLVRYQAGSEILPQIHSLLFYVDKGNPLGPELRNPADDPQFENWEKPVLVWAEKNVADFSNFNKPLPPDSLVLNEGLTAPRPADIDIKFIRPQSGDFIDGRISVSAEINSANLLSKAELYLNNNLLDTESGIAKNNFRYEAVLSPSTLGLQNLLRLVAWDDKNNSREVSLIVFSRL